MVVKARGAERVKTRKCLDGLLEKVETNCALQFLLQLPVFLLEVFQRILGEGHAWRTEKIRCSLCDFRDRKWERACRGGRSRTKERRSCGQSKEKTKR